MTIDSFWKWLAVGSQGSSPGWRNIVNLFLPVHLVIGYVCMQLIQTDPYEFARTALFPAASILVGLSLAWTTRASTALQNKNLRDKLITDYRPAEDYVFGYQLAILVIIGMVVYICVMAAGGLDISVFGKDIDKYLSGYWMYTAISVALRECWGVVNFTNMLTLLDYRK